MTEHSEFDAGRDPELGELMAEAFDGPDPGGYLARLGTALSRLPSRRSQWDVLAEWARPSVLVAAIAAGFVLGLTLWHHWRERMDPVAATNPVSMAMLDASRLGETQVIYTVLEEK